ncbi:MAG: alpha-amylase family glycosyl hydrolase [Lachnospiraceae bacterium]|nr:alpha-amylase family glycosyl hydrolase [Lachnospiraceae bacterium]
MAWFDEAVFYHIYPLGMLGAPKQNDYGEPVHRLRELLPWISHIKSIGCNAIYIGPLFESVGHGYETTDYRKLDSRLGDNQDLKDFVSECHAQGLRVIFDGVFNHTGRDFFAFKDLQANREGSFGKDWYCNVNFWGNNSYNDGFSYENWGGYDLLVKLNQRNPAVRDYIADVIRFWVSEFDVDGIRLDAADVLDFDFMKMLRQVADSVKPDFWLMGEVIHGEYSRWANESTLHSVTNYHLHKALYSGHNDHNYFEIAHTVRRLNDMGQSGSGLKLYNFVDNHDVERIHTKLANKADFFPVHVLLYTLPGIPSLYYGSEFGIDGHKHRGGSDDDIRPHLKLEDFADALQTNPCTGIVSRLGKIRQAVPALSYGDYRELALTNRQYTFARSLDGNTVLVSVNNDDQDARISVGNLPDGTYIGAISGETLQVQGGGASFCVKAHAGEIFIPAALCEGRTGLDLEEMAKEAAEKAAAEKAAAEKAAAEKAEEKVDTEKAEAEKVAEDIQAESVAVEAKPAPTPDPAVQAARTDYENMSIEELQAAILGKMAKNGPVTDQMRRTVDENIYRDSLLNWVRSFR